jgi:glycosyltransferase involved in cell wall biosynthesis
MGSETKRRKILLSAYACEPNRGSEPGVGWEWATRLAARHDLIVITRANNRGVIEAEFVKQPATHAPRFIFVDLPSCITWLKSKGIFPVSIYYIFWQLAARLAVNLRLKDFDLVHHVTFNGFRFPGAWWGSPIPVVLGPLGGGSVASSAYRRCFGWRWIFEWLRGLSVRMWLLNPWTVSSLRAAGAVLAVGEEMAARFAKLGIRADLMLETAVPHGLEEPRDYVPGAERRDFLLVGNLEPWKAWQIAFEAFARAAQAGMRDQRLVVVGTGRQQSEAQDLAKRLGIGDQVEFIGLLPRETLWERLSTARALVFPSIRDTSGNAVLEAMALSCPVICFRHQGVAWMTDKTCAIRIDPGQWDASLEGFAAAIATLAKEDAIVETLGKAGRQRAIREFSWDAKINKVESIYERMMAKHSKVISSNY